MKRTRLFAMTAVGLAFAIAAAWLVIRDKGDGQSTGKIVLAEAAEVSELAMDRYAKTLSERVNDVGLVDYAGLKADPEDLNAFLTSAANLDSAVFDSWTDSERIAFWCNAYNAYTLKAIIENYPIKSSFFKSLAHPKNSIRQISGVWDTLRWPVIGKQMTLDMIEHETLRVHFDEPRIHAVLVCAAMSCPPLRNEPYTADQLDEQLNDQMTAYMSVKDRFRIDREKNVVYLSSILKWYGEDFVKSYGVDGGFGGRGEVERAVLNGLAPHISEADAEYLRTATYSVGYLDYDWALNEQ